MQANSYNSEYFPTWCPGCGNYGIWAALKAALAAKNLQPDQFAIVYGIGCSGNMNDFIKAYGFHALHGRALPNAIGLRLANHKLPVVVVGGDGDLLGEGGNHFLHACRGNYNLTVIIHDNRVYGLTTGQTSPTASQGFKSKSTPLGIIETPVNQLSLAITQGATFVAQGFAGNIPQLTELIRQGMEHPGLAIISTLQPCVTFNKVNTYQFFRERVYQLENHDSSNFSQALTVATDPEKIATGVIYKTIRPTYEASLSQLEKTALVDATLQTNLEPLLDEFA